MSPERREAAARHVANVLRRQSAELDKKEPERVTELLDATEPGALADLFEQSQAVEDDDGMVQAEVVEFDYLGAAASSPERAVWEYKGERSAGVAPLKSTMFGAGVNFIEVNGKVRPVDIRGAYLLIEGGDEKYSTPSGRHAEHD